MIDPLSFLRDLRSSAPPAVVHLVGDDTWLRETLETRIIAVWCGETGDRQTERLVGTGSLGDLAGAMGAGSLFAEKKVIVLTDPSPGEKGKPLSGMGKNQLSLLEKAIRALPVELNRLVIETGSLKKTSAVLKKLSNLATQVDVSTPKGAQRKHWLQLLAKRAGIKLERDLTEAMGATGSSLGVLAADLEKLALAVPEGAVAGLERWKELSQADPEATVWEIGDHLGAGDVGKALIGLRTLESQGLTIHEILPSLLAWNQQRLRVKSFSQSGGSGGPEGVHSFVVRKIGTQVANRSLSEIREEQKALLYLDRCTKQSWENPEVLLEEFFVRVGSGGFR